MSVGSMSLVLVAVVSPAPEMNLLGAKVPRARVPQNSPAEIWSFSPTAKSVMVSIPSNILQWVRLITPEAQLFLIPTRRQKTFQTDCKNKLSHVKLKTAQFGSIAQSVELGTHKPSVSSSSLLRAIITNPASRGVFVFLSGSSTTRKPFRYKPERVQTYNQNSPHPLR
jgi:hypothetical protein